MSLKAPSNFCRVIKKQRLKTVWTKTQKVICCCKPSSGRNDDYINCVKRQRLVTTPPYRATLAGCSWASRVQTRRHGVQLPARSSISVPRGIVPTSRSCHIMATSSIRHPTAPGRIVPLTQLLWPTGFLCGWPVGLEFLARQLAGSGYWREVSDNLWRRFCLQRTDVCIYISICIHHLLEVSRRCAI